MKFMSEQRQRGLRRRNAPLTRARTIGERPATSRSRRAVAGAGASDAAAFTPQGPRHAVAPARSIAKRSVAAGRYGVRGSGRRLRRGVATLDYALLIGVVLPLAAFVLVIAPRIMLRVYEMVCTMVSWPFM